MKKIVIFWCGILLSCNNAQQQDKLLLGADLSYVNETEDCGGVYFDGDKKTDPFKLFKKYGCGIVRVRLWHNPSWTQYSNYADVEKTIRRAREAGMKVLLDFHSSDDWADPQKQIIPDAWKDIRDLQVLCDSVYHYTYNVLRRLNGKGLLPEMVQTGNEINNEILMPGYYKEGDTINWNRNIALINSGIEAVKDMSQVASFTPEVMIHIAQPENALKWFNIATSKGLDDFDIIGISYYSKWSEYSLDELYKAISELKTTYNKEVIVAETAYPWTTESIDSAGNVLGDDALVEGYPATPEGQLKYLTDLKGAVIKGGGSGIIYWEPAWISSSCRTRWGQGSHWENATFFSFDGKTLPSMNFFSQDF